MHAFKIVLAIGTILLYIFVIVFPWRKPGKRRREHSNFGV
jgi:hypothetical protein